MTTVILLAANMDEDGQGLIEIVSPLHLLY